MWIHTPHSECWRALPLCLWKRCGFHGDGRRLCLPHFPQHDRLKNTQTHYTLAVAELWSLHPASHLLVTLTSSYIFLKWKKKKKKLHAATLQWRCNYRIISCTIVHASRFTTNKYVFFKKKYNTSPDFEALKVWHWLNQPEPQHVSERVQVLLSHISLLQPPKTLCTLRSQQRQAIFWAKTFQNSYWTYMHKVHCSSPIQ